MNPQDLIELRELLRKKFREHDFCIGEEEVEKVFRELLSEPEPIESSNPGPGLSPEEFSSLMETHIKDIKNVFDKDSTFYRYMTKK